MIDIKFSKFIVISLLIFQGGNLSGQQSHLSLFPLKEVTLLNSPFNAAMEVDLKYILEMDPDRLLAPFLKDAGLEPKAENYPNWENTGLDGHIGGHYLTALSQMVASAGSQEALNRLNYMVQELRRVQIAHGDGYVGGVPNSKEVWPDIKKGNIRASSFGLNDRWVPLYNIHKTYAGLKDAYEIAGIDLARVMLIDFTDWMVDLVAGLNEDQIQDMLRSEHGGLNEVFADVARITGEAKYLDLARKFSHQALLNPMAAHEDILNGMHANTQIPKIIGFEAIAQLEGDAEFHKAATFFWDNVVNERSVAIGGNSVREHFNPIDDFSSMISNIQGPETCNTYNMLKLSEKLFMADPDEKYVDYYERALYNHILGSQHPDQGGFVYFTPMRPGHYRIYSQPETSFWCCVGSGIENHGKYNKFIYAHSSDELYVNLFIPSQLNWEEKSLSLTQVNKFPDVLETSFKINADRPQQLTLKLRIPQWADPDETSISLNGTILNETPVPGTYLDIQRLWVEGDQLDIKFGTAVRSIPLPDDSGYVALAFGPVILGAKTNSEYLEGLFADDSRGGHIPGGPKVPLSETPLFLIDHPELLPKEMVREEKDELEFSTRRLYPSAYDDLKFIPFYKIHDSRYVVYLPVYTPKTLADEEKRREEAAKAEKELEARTIDQVAPGEQQPEADHFVQSEASNIGVHQDRHWRDAKGWFSYVLQDENKEADFLQVTYYGLDANRNFKIYLNDILVAHETLQGNQGDLFFVKEYPISSEIKGAHIGNLRLRFEADPGSQTAGVYGVRLVKDLK